MRMSSSLVPRYAFRDFTEITHEFLTNKGIRFLMLDLDNTLAKYSEHAPSEVSAQWVADMKAGGISLFFISNSRRKDRVDVFAKSLALDYIKEARKPSPDSLLQAMKSENFSPGETAFLGDQIFTDTLAANRAGVLSMIVRPLSLKNPLLFLRFVIELPFRAVCANRKVESLRVES